MGRNDTLNERFSWAPGDVQEGAVGKSEPTPLVRPLTPDSTDPGVGKMNPQATANEEDPDA